MITLFICDDMLKTYREGGMNENKIEEMTGEIQRIFSDPNFQIHFGIYTMRATGYCDVLPPLKEEVGASYSRYLTISD